MSAPCPLDPECPPHLPDAVPTCTGNSPNIGTSPFHETDKTLDKSDGSYNIS